MSKITQAFAGKKALIGFVTGGDPSLEMTEQLVMAMEQAGADIVEIGIPFSDPTAEGPVIEVASMRALAAGCTVEKLFALVERLRRQVHIPLLFMTYANPVFAYGKEAFMQRCQQVGIDGVIIPDTPFEEKGEFLDACRAHGIDFISMVAPTSHERVSAIAKESEGFVYCVSSLGVTGMRSSFSDQLAQTVAAARAATDTPCAIGFGVSGPAQARAMAQIADGVIVGSAIVKIVEEYGEQSVPHVQTFVRSLRAALDA